MKTTKLLTLLSVIGLSSTLKAASYDTLPKGVNTLVFKQVMAMNMGTKFNSRGEKESLNLKQEFSSSKLEELSSVIKSYFDELKNLSPQSYNEFSLGEYAADIDANLNAQGLGYGHGITDRLTVYGSLPFYHIKTDIRINQTKNSTIRNVQDTIGNKPTNSALSKAIQDLTMQLPNAGIGLLQSVVVNYYNYKPIGKWEKSALGDAEVGAIYKLTDYTDRGLAISGGLVLPTGDADDADSLQDVATGDGQLDTFVELSGGFDVRGPELQFDLKTRYTYQFASKKEFRLYDDADLPLSDTKGTLTEKLGNKIDITASLTHNTYEWLSLQASYIFGSTGTATYTGAANQKMLEALGAYSANSNHWLKVAANFSTINLFKKGSFAVPFDVGVSAQRLLSAKNLNGYDRIDIDLRMYF